MIDSSVIIFNIQFNIQLTILVGLVDYCDKSPTLCLKNSQTFSVITWKRIITF